MFCYLRILVLIFLFSYSMVLYEGTALNAGGNRKVRLEDVGIVVYQGQANFQLSPLYYSQANGIYTEQGIRLTIYYAGSVEAALHLLEQGQVHGALLPAVAIVRAIYSDRQLGIFMQYLQQSPYAAVATSVEGLGDPLDLRDRRIGFELANYDARLALVLFLRRYNLEGQAELVQTPTDAINGMLNRNVDAAITNRIQVPGLLDGQDFPYFVWQVLREGDQAMPGDAFVTLRSYLSDENRALLHRFARATLEGMRVIVRNPDRAAWDVVLPYEREFSVNQITTLQNELRFLGDYMQGPHSFDLLGTAQLKEYQFLLKKMVEVGMLSAEVPANRLFVF